MMFKGIGLALGACFIWGLIFVIPQFMTGFSVMEIVLGRYLFYGMASALIFLKAKLQGRCCYSQSIWIKALFFSLIVTIGYYICTVLALRYLPPEICALVFGISPITAALYGNWQQREISFRSLIIPSMLFLLGLIVIHIPHLETSTSLSYCIVGLIFSFLALGIWSWYLVENSRFLKDNLEVHSNDWTTLMGVTTLFWVVIFAGVLSLFFADQLHAEKYFTFNDELKMFLIGSAILGWLCSWVGAFLWNQASIYLPVSLAGQLTIFENIFGVLFIYIVKQSVPSFLECMGITILLTAIIYGIRTFTKKKVHGQAILH